MTKDESKIKDWRSTGRRKGRRELYNAFVPYKCVGYRLPDGSRSNCGKTSKEPPKDAPKWFDEIWPKENRVLDYQLQVDHESKEFDNNDLDFINWKCAVCHKKDDRATGKGEAQKGTGLW
jgi:hypothetical protein